jgi:hypothetical protein
MLLGSMSGEGMGSCVGVIGITTTRNVVESYFSVSSRLASAPGRWPFWIISAHKGERVRELIAGRGC